MKVAFAGTPEFAATILDGIIASPHDVGLAISQPDGRRGRGRRTTPTPVAELARERDVRLLQPARIGEAADAISEHDVLVVAAYGQILRAATLNAARLGAWNVHASLLPKYRGAAPIERAIIAGEPETGVTIIAMDEGLDTGAIGLQRSAPIHPDTTGGELTATLARLGSEAIVEVLGLLEGGDLTLAEQDSHLATYAAKLADEDTVIGWDDGAGRIKNLVRALAPRIGARTFHPDVDGPVKLWASEVVEGPEAGVTPGQIRTENGRLLVACGSGTLEVLELQVPGGRRVRAADFLRGNALEGAFLG